MNKYSSTWPGSSYLIKTPKNPQSAATCLLIDQGMELEKNMLLYQAHAQKKINPEKLESGDQTRWEGVAAFDNEKNSKRDITLLASR